MHHFYPEDYQPYLEDKLPANEGKIPKGFQPPEQGGTLLDVGFGAGKFLQRMCNAGWKVTGIDFSAIAVAQVQGKGFEVYQGSLPHPQLKGRQFDFVFLRQVLEHLHDPHAALCHAATLLPSGGKLVVSVPHLNSLSFRWFRENWFGIDFPRHLFFFNKKTLAGMVERAGFQVLEIQPVRHGKWIWEAAREAVRNRRGGFTGRLLQNRLMSGLAASIGIWTGFPEGLQLLATKA